jgi:hypothetical protein
MFSQFIYTTDNSRFHGGKGGIDDLSRKLLISKPCDSSLAICLDHFYQLTTVSGQMNELLTQFTLGNFQYIANTLNLAKYNQLSLLLYSLKLPTNNKCIPCAQRECEVIYENLRLQMVHTWSTLWQSIQLFSSNAVLKDQLEVATKRASILDSMVSINAYIQQIKNRIFLFEPQDETVDLATLRQEYFAYISGYGYPTGGVFDPDKLGNIIQQLQNGVALNNIHYLPLPTPPPTPQQTPYPTPEPTPYPLSIPIETLSTYQLQKLTANQFNAYWGTYTTRSQFSPIWNNLTTEKKLAIVNNPNLPGSIKAIVPDLYEFLIPI